MTYKVGLLGLGTVGTGTAEILTDPTGRHPLLQTLEIAKVGVRSLDKPRAVSFPPNVLTDDLTAIARDPDIDIVVELIGGIEPARTLILEAIAHGKHVVTANKAVMSRHGDEIFDAANEKGVYVMLEAAVGGGIPVIQPLKQALGVNRIQRVTGIVNGTTNYILTRMKNEGADFADVLADAQKLGYAEADPTADVDGFDAADKIAILASLAFGGRIQLDRVHCEGIRNIGATDIAYAERLDFTIKLLAIAQEDRAEDPSQGTNQQLSVKVHPTLLPNSHPLARVDGVFNAILVEGDPLGQVMFFGPGAGAGATASAVVSDVLNIVAILKTETEPIPHPLLSCTHQHFCAIAPMSESVSRFYARVKTQDSPGVIGSLGTCFGDRGVSLESVVQIDRGENLAEIVVVTHHVREGSFREALGAIEQLDAVVDIPSVIRVW